MSAALPIVGHHPEAELDPDNRAEELAQDRAEAAPFHILDYLCRACALGDGKWLDAGAAERKLTRGDACTCDELLVVAFNGRPDSKLRALHELLERMRADVIFRGSVRSVFLPAALRDVAEDDADADADFAVEAYLDRADE